VLKERHPLTRIQRNLNRWKEVDAWQQARLSDLASKIIIPRVHRRKGTWMSPDTSSTRFSGLALLVWDKKGLELPASAIPFTSAVD
jgi:hypothetical protein